MTMTVSRAESLFTPENIAEHLQVSVRTVRRLIDAGKIKTLRVGRLIRITPAALQAYMTEVVAE
jgi:excisionase family DNA binding protein